MRKLIVNCDDLGISECVNEAIFDCHVNGVVTSATLMANMPAAESAAQECRAFKELGIGVHLNLTLGYPVSKPDDIPLLLSPEGCFYSNKEMPKLLKYPNRLVYRQVYKELDSQVKKCRRLGVPITHLDSHHHICRMPIAMFAMADVARENGIRAVRSIRGCYNKEIVQQLIFNPKRLIAESGHAVNHYLFRSFFKLNTPDCKAAPNILPLEKRRNLSDAYVALVNLLPRGIAEIAFHPGGVGAYSGDTNAMAQRRVEEYTLAKSASLKSAINAAGIELIHFGNL
ncbi:MAG TPA: ChbG/HpnK family deacetylase [Cyclobacteriaceae bacterium]|nr:ChbG/HpnK family deacetylase [Cyclobacteriaceae bacterium]